MAGMVDKLRKGATTMVKPDGVTYSCKSCQSRDRCMERSRRYTCKDYKRRTHAEVFYKPGRFQRRQQTPTKG
ncbi:MAG: hypothetical protein F8N38_01090 [Hungatella sp.]|nr:hypothetical protein [Hungatella sp.]